CGAIVPLAYGAIVAHQRHPGGGRDPVHRAAMTGSICCATREGPRSGASRANRMRSGRRRVHGSRPVPSGARAGALGAGMTLLMAPSLPTNVIPAKAGTQYTV